MAEHIPTEHQQLADELSALFDQFIAKLPYAETPEEPVQAIYGYLSISEEFRHTAIATVADSEALQTLQRLQVDEAREVQQFSEAFRPLARKMIAAGEALEYTIDVKLSRLNRGALQIYAIAKEIARDRIDLQNWVGEMRRHLKRRTHRGQAAMAEPPAV
jgi:hypothetical protein